KTQILGLKCRKFARVTRQSRIVPNPKFRQVSHGHKGLPNRSKWYSIQKVSESVNFLLVVKNLFKRILQLKQLLAILLQNVSTLPIPPPPTCDNCTKENCPTCLTYSK
ncbi:hypothetical protein BT96DRAFT_1103396, partial [Gymnopus androsaceus JB14]